MTFTARNAATIRDAVLADRRARYLTAGRDLDIQQGSDAYAEAEAYALEEEALELGAKEAAERVLVRSATGEDLDAFAEDLGTERQAATYARRRVAITGTAGATLSIAGQTLNAASGVRYAPIDTAGAALTSVVMDGFGAATVLTQADTAGTTGNAETGTVLTWSSTPTSMGATGTTLDGGAGARDAEEEELDAALQTRLLELMRERPARGHPADWRAKAMEIDGVTNAFVFPLVAPPTSTPGAGTPHTPGCVTVVVVGPAQGDSTTNSRIVEGVAGAALPAHKGYFEGTHEADGDETTSGSQWRPVSMEEGDYTVEAANTQSQNVVATLVLASGSTWSWTGAALTGVTATSSAIVVVGDHSAKAGKDALVFVGTSGVGSTRGGWRKVTIATAVFGGVNTTLTFSAALASAPDHTRGVYPAPSVWSALRLAAFAHFDALAPSDVDTATFPRSARFPPESWGAGYYAKLYRQLLARDLMTVSGVLTAVVATPAADVTPSQAKTIVELEEFLVTQ